MQKSFAASCLDAVSHHDAFPAGWIACFTRALLLQPPKSRVKGAKSKEQQALERKAPR
jgi:hypothetical protein